MLGPTGDLASKLGELKGEVKCLSFSSSGDHLALGHADGGLQVVEWPGLRVKLDHRWGRLARVGVGVCAGDLAAGAQVHHQFRVLYLHSIGPADQLRHQAHIRQNACAHRLHTGTLKLPAVHRRACSGPLKLRDGVRDVDVAPGPRAHAVAVVLDNGSAEVWDWEAGELVVRVGLARGACRLCATLQLDMLTPHELMVGLQPLLLYYGML